MSANFNNILNTRADTVEAPKQLPPGKYGATVKDIKSGTSTQKKTPYVEFIFDVHQVLDTQPENLDAAGAALSKGPVEQKLSFYLTERSLYRLVDFLEGDLGITRSGRTIAEMVTQAPGASCSVTIDLEEGKDGKSYPNIKATGKL